MIVLFTAGLCLFLFFPPKVGFVNLLESYGHSWQPQLNTSPMRQIQRVVLLSLLLDINTPGMVRPAPEHISGQADTVG